MNKLYGKEVLVEHTVNVCGVIIKAKVIKTEKDYYDIHILNPKYKQEEMNTIDRQEPIEYKPTEDSLRQLIWEHIIWDNESTKDFIATAEVKITFEEI
tara:strand:- start:1312 stop:1605 length:294 start_codon:yes stop_codon:yes gene_type:complete